MDPGGILFQSLDPVFHVLLGWVLPLMFVMAGLKLVVEPWLKGLAGEAGVAKKLERLAPDVRNDVLLPDESGELTQVDHLALTPEGIWVIETKNMGGTILGKAKDKRWTQKIGKRTHKFQNPTNQNYRHIKSLEASLPGTPVFGLVVFSDRASFPKGLPEGVVKSRDLEHHLRGNLGEGPVPGALQVKWDALQHRMRSGKEAKRAHMAGIEARHGKDWKQRIGMGFLATAVIVFIAVRLIL